MNLADYYTLDAIRERVNKLKDENVASSDEESHDMEWWVSGLNQFPAKESID